MPPTGYGGIEWVVSLLADGLVEAGHDVTLFASGDSHTKAKLASVFPEAPSERDRPDVPGAPARAALLRRARTSSTSSTTTRACSALTLGGAVATPVVHTVHGPLDGEPGELYEQVARVAPGVGLISISMNQRKPRPDLHWIANCPNALDFSRLSVHSRTAATTCSSSAA